MKKNILIFVLLFISLSAKSHTDTTATIPKIEILFSKEYIRETELANKIFKDDIGLTDSQNLILATNNSFYCIGYMGYMGKSVEKRTVKSFCTVGNDVYFADKNTLYRIDTNDKESKVMSIPFTPQRMWSGKKMIYAVKTVGKESRIYAFLPNDKKSVCFYTAEDTVICVKEFRTRIMALTSKSLLIIDTENRQFTETQIDTKVIGRLKSMAVDEQKGVFYLATSQGVYRTYEGKLQFVCKETGTLCYDKDGLIIFNAQEPYVIRLLNNLLYAPKKGVKIEIR